MKRRKYLKVAVTSEEYADLSLRADHDGLTLAAYVGAKLAGERQVVEVDGLLARIESRLATPVANMTKTIPDTLEPLLVENLFLLRELAAERNAQVLVRVAQRLNTLYPERTKL